MQIKFSLDGMNVQIDALGGVVWAEENLLKKLYAWRVGCQFIDLSNKEQDLIAKFVFAKQTELRRYRLMWRE